MTDNLCNFVLWKISIILIYKQPLESIHYIRARNPKYLSIPGKIPLCELSWQGRFSDSASVYFKFTYAFSQDTFGVNMILFWLSIYTVYIVYIHSDISSLAMRSLILDFLLKTGFYDWGFQMNSVFIRAALYDCHDSTSVKKKTLKAIVHHSLLEIMSRLKLALQLSPFSYRSQVIHCSHSEEFTKFHTSKIKFDLFF